MTKIFTVNYTDSNMSQIGNTEYYMSIASAKKDLSDHNYSEVSPEDFNDNTRGQWHKAATYFFSESFAYLGFIEANP